MTKKTLMPGMGLDLENPNEQAVSDGPVECLGKTFANDTERREYYLQILAEKLNDPEFRKIEGFPIGEDIDILNLSDPPYYTACPNPFIADFIAHYGRSYDSTEIYKREPYAADVSEGKNDPIYNAHTYHTKVPHKAIMRYILHYTNPGDVVFDGFCGTGMTGVAAQLCGDREVVSSLGLKVQSDGAVVGSGELERYSLGARRAVLNDLSPIACFIANNYSNLSQLETFVSDAYDSINVVENKLAALFHLNGNKVLNGVWSDVFICPNCAADVNYWDHSVDGSGKILDEFKCKSCGTLCSKSSSKSSGAQKLERAFETIYDKKIRDTISVPKFSLVREEIKCEGKNTFVGADFSRQNDLELQASEFEFPIPILKFEAGRQTNKLINGSGIIYSHQMYTPRTLCAYSMLWSMHLKSHKNTILFRYCLSAINNYVSRKQGFFGGGGGVAGTLFTPSVHLERNIFDVLRRKIKKISTMYTGKRTTYVTNQSSGYLKNIPSESVDYMFVDPPFGESIQYSELNSFVEAWLKVKTMPKDDCVLNYVHKKDLNFYLDTMRSAFKEFYRIIKPGRWITVEFSNSQSSVWNAIQTAMQDSGFVVSNVSALDKMQLSFNSVTTTTSVKQDLIISAYKPNGGFEQRFCSETDEDGVWDFIRTHLGYLPIVKRNGNEQMKIPERDPRILFDQVVSYFVRNLRDVPLSSKEFQEGLRERFAERDGMIFLPEQVSQYDKARMTGAQLRQLTIFVDDEASAIEWLRQLLNDKPQTYQDVHPKFIHELSGWKKAEMQLELATLLEQNFLKFDGAGQIPAQIHSYLSTNFKEMRNLTKDDSALLQKAKDRWYVPNPDREEDLQKLRDRSLLKQFEEYKNHTGKKLKLIRMESVRAGFKKAWIDRDYKTIIEVCTGLMKPDTLMRDNNRQPLRCQYESEAQLQTIPEGIQKRGGSLGA